MKIKGRKMAENLTFIVEKRTKVLRTRSQSVSPNRGIL